MLKEGDERFLCGTVVHGRDAQHHCWFYNEHKKRCMVCEDIDYMHTTSNTRNVVLPCGKYYGWLTTAVLKSHGATCDACREISITDLAPLDLQVGDCFEEAYSNLKRAKSVYESAVRNESRGLTPTTEQTRKNLWFAEKVHEKATHELLLYGHILYWEDHYDPYANDTVSMDMPMMTVFLGSSSDMTYYKEGPLGTNTILKCRYANGPTYFGGDSECCVAIHSPHHSTTRIDLLTWRSWIIVKALVDQERLETILKDFFGDYGTLISYYAYPNAEERFESFCAYLLNFYNNDAKILDRDLVRQDLLLYFDS